MLLPCLHADLPVHPAAFALLISTLISWLRCRSCTFYSPWGACLADLPRTRVPAHLACPTRMSAASLLQVLQDPERRAAYDRQRALAAAAQLVHINESVDLEEMDTWEVEGQPCYSWPCRCGGSYLLLADDAVAAAAAAAGAEASGQSVPADLAVPCSTCSLHICVLLPPNLQSSR